MGHSTLTLKMGLGWPRGGRDTPKPLSAGDAGSSSALSPPDDVRAGLSKPSLPKEGLSLVWVGGKKQKQARGGAQWLADSCWWRCQMVIRLRP